MDLVHGPYLSEVDAPGRWRNGKDWDRCMFRHLEELAHLYLDANQLDRCLSICQLALTQNRYNEEIYQVEMRAYAALGDRASIVRRYQASKSALEEGLGIPPSQETESLYPI